MEKNSYRVLKKVLLSLFLILWAVYGLGKLAGVLVFLPSIYWLTLLINSVFHILSVFIIFFYLLSFRPGGLKVFGKYVAVLYTVFYVVQGFVVNRLVIPDLASPDIWMLLPGPGIFVAAVAFYCLYRYGFGRELPAGGIDFKLYGKSLLVPVCFLFVVYLPLPQGRVEVKTDYYEKYKQLVIPEGVDPNEGNALALYTEAFAAMADPNRVSELDRGEWSGEYSDKELETVRGYVRDNAETVELLEEAVEKPFYIEQPEYQGPLIGFKYEQLKEFRQAAYLLTYKAKLEALEGNYEEAFESIVTMKKMSDHMMGPRSLIDQLVGIAIDAMAAEAAIDVMYYSEPGLKDLMEFQEELRGLSEEDVPIDMAYEHFMQMDLVQRLFTDEGDGKGVLSGGGIYEYMDAFGDIGVDGPRPLEGLYNLPIKRRPIEEELKKVYEEFQELSKYSPAELKEKGLDFEEPEGDGYKRMLPVFGGRMENFYVDILRPALGAVLKIGYRIRTYNDAVRTILALEIYEKQTGAYPQTLQTLVTEGVLKELPMDSFNTDGLTYEKTEDGFRLYSYGRDFEDDGGEHDFDWGDDGGDHVFWPVVERQKPDSRDK